MNKVILLLSCLSFSFINAQIGYIATSDNKIYQLNDDYSYTYITTVNLTGDNNRIVDIAISPSNTFYAVTSWEKLIQIDILTGNHIENQFGY